MMNDYTKIERQKKLRCIIEDKGIGDQTGMLIALKKEGIDTTQATISRDLQEMGYVKIRLGPGIYRYELLNRSSQSNIKARLSTMFHDFVTEIKSSDNIIVVKTVPGNAGGVASLIDNLENPKILGTVAGDDTIIIVVNNKKNRAEIEYQFNALL
ncbi:arginine repressor [candidate division KSB1 bacterium]|nr:MAG: arginine repressor [candidate division KSB1 bacterium]